MKPVGWSRPDGMGVRTATVNGQTYTLDRRFYESHGRWRRHFRLSRPDGTLVPGIHNYADAVAWLWRMRRSDGEK